MSQKRSIGPKGPRKRSRAGISSSQYTLDDDDEPSTNNEPVRTWEIRAAGRGRYGGRRRNTKVTEMREMSVDQPGPSFGDTAPDTGPGEVVVEVPDLLRSKNRKRKQRNDSVSTID